jgi:hypothetical protein
MVYGSGPAGEGSARGPPACVAALDWCPKQLGPGDGWAPQFWPERCTRLQSANELGRPHRRPAPAVFSRQSTRARNPRPAPASRARAATAGGRSIGRADTSPAHARTGRGSPKTCGRFLQKFQGARAAATGRATTTAWRRSVQAGQGLPLPEHPGQDCGGLARAPFAPHAVDAQLLRPRSRCPLASPPCEANQTKPRRVSLPYGSGSLSNHLTRCWAEAFRSPPGSPRAYNHRTAHRPREIACDSV